MRCISRSVMAGCLLIIATSVIPNALWGEDEHAEADLEFDRDLTLPALLDTTLQRHPEAGVLAAGRATAEAESAYGRYWVPEMAELSGFHLSDRQLDDIGAYENEVTLSVPFWLPGEKRAQTRLGEASLTAHASRSVEFRWQVSAVLRNRLWKLRLALRQWELAREQEQRLADVLEQVTLFTEVGDLSRADQLATLQELAIWKAETMTLEAEYRDAVREYASVTGMNRFPADISEVLSEKQGIEDDHPALQSAMDRLAEATASTDLSRQENSARPALQVFWRGFSGDRLSPDVNALGIGLAVPLGKSPKRGPEIARANELLALAEAELIKTKRKLDMQLHEARHMLETTRRQLENSMQMIEAANERHRLDRLSFELGEFSITEWLRRLSVLKDIERSHELLLIREGAAIASYNQAVGDTL
ncbi:MAG: TolC family protein [Xanthomonadales bacterium]|nr:TolC family protein [Xanthomonadales bacterium]